MTVKTSRKDDVVDITDRVQKLVNEEEIESGVATLFVKHTTCAITTSEFANDVVNDLLDFLREVSPDLDYKHDRKHAPDHILSSIIGPSLSIPIAEGKLSLGTWQKIVLVELAGPREREIEVILQEV
ncbi:MAG: hypothetical protein UU21_C0018G0020 [Candidatus Levybacteria bacterium GW2011_GWA2_40_8]|nr:MAG: hypothetical protein UU21_C0018G0020 [Candidatus Levybacteria bacterium GW2011_GWA2_40_8]